MMIFSESYTLNKKWSLSVLSATEWYLQTFTYWRGAIWYREHVIGNLSLVTKSGSVFLPLWSSQVSQLRETEDVLELMKLRRTGQWIFEGMCQNLVPSPQYLQWCGSPPLLKSSCELMWKQHN